MPLGYAFAQVAPEQGIFIAFAIGAFPLDALLVLLRRILQKFLGETPGSDEEKDNVIHIPGVNRDIADRLSREDVMTILQLAYCDPVRVCMRSNLSFIFIADCMSQALLWIYLRNGVDKLAPVGLRGAVEVRNFISGLDGKNSTDSYWKSEYERTSAVLPKLAERIGVLGLELETTFREVAEDPFTEFLAEIWCSGERAASC